MNSYNKKILLIVVSAFFIGACGDLDLEPEDRASANLIFSEPDQYEAFLAKIYAGLAVTGQSGPAGDADIAGIDEGFSQYLRGYWKAQELPTDEAVTAWGDIGIQDFHEHSWTAGNPFTTAFYARIFYQIGLANEFLRLTSDVTTSEVDEIDKFRAEARFLRALSYWHGLDLFRNIPFFTENDVLGSNPPIQGTPQQLFDYIESELIDISDKLFEAGSAPYGRADQGAASTLLAKLYLNAEVYIGQSKYTECIESANKVINSGVYSLTPQYNQLFLTDNDNSGEIIFPVAFDGSATRSFGGMTFLTHMPVGGSMNAEDFGIDGGWAGMRTTSFFVDLFPDDQGNMDSRSGLLWTDGQAKEIQSLTNFTDGIGVVKYRNVSSTGVPGSDAAHPDTDFPMFRLADVYLMYAEAVVRGGTGGDLATAVNYVNEIRERAYGDATGNITGGELTLDFILDERSRELFWECQRRTDLVRFDQFSDAGIWPWKGGVINGETTEAFRDIYPIPDNEIRSNSNLTQNDGY